MRMGFDLDGVLANFHDDFQQVLAKVNNTPYRPFLHGGPQTWNWPQEESGYTNEEVSKAWDYVVQPRVKFWQNHPVLDVFGMEAIANLTFTRNHAIYFITDRGGKRAYAEAKLQSEYWLEDHGVRTPTVLITGGAEMKGLAAKALSLDFMVDDRPENLFAIAEHSPDTRRYLVKAAYNQWAQHDPRVRPVRNVQDVLLMEDV